MEYTNKHRNLNTIVGILGVSLLLVIFMLSTNPETIALPLLIVPFGLIGADVYLAFRLLFRMTGVNSATSRIVPVLLAVSVVLLLLLNSLHQLSWRDFILVSGFIVIFVLYIKRASFLR